MKDESNVLESLIEKVKLESDLYKKCEIIKDKVIKSMNNLRKIVDKVESITDLSYWPIPTYIDLLFGI